MVRIGCRQLIRDCLGFAVCAGQGQGQSRAQAWIVAGLTIEDAARQLSGFFDVSTDQLRPARPCEMAGSHIGKVAAFGHPGGVLIEASRVSDFPGPSACLGSRANHLELARSVRAHSRCFIAALSSPAMTANWYNNRRVDIVSMPSATACSAVFRAASSRPLPQYAWARFEYG